jgi:Flp pilus assembly protein TadD
VAYLNTEAESVFVDASARQVNDDLTAALRLFRRAVELDGADPKYWIALGVCLSKLRHWSEAAKALQRGVGLKPHYAEADARLFLAEALLSSGDRKRAREQFQHIVGMERSYPSYDRPMDEARRRLGET